MFQISDTQKIGIALLSFGSFFMFLGVLLFLDGALLALGNLFIVVGIVFLNGIQKTIRIFTEKTRIPGVVCFLGGIAILLKGYPKIGIVTELIGFITLFGNQFPVVLSYLRRIQFIGSFLNLPVVSPILEYLFPSAKPTTASKEE